MVANSDSNVCQGFRLCSVPSKGVSDYFPPPVELDVQMTISDASTEEEVVPGDTNLVSRVTMTLFFNVISVRTTQVINGKETKRRKKAVEKEKFIFATW